MERSKTELIDPGLMMKIVICQFWVTGFMTVVAFFFSLIAGLSALLGGLTVALPSLYMAWRLNRPVAQASVALGILLNAELGKLVLTGCFIVVSFSLVKDLEVWAYFTALVVVIASNIAMPITLGVRSR
jgi:F0F1-type ATP synthase assembly protein I